MSDIEYGIKTSKELESILELYYGARGKGLRFIATVKNKLVHEEGYDNIKSYLRNFI